MIRKTALNTIVFFYLVLFVYAATTKLIEFEKFYIQLSQSPMLSSHARIITHVVLASELLVSGLIVVEQTRLLGLLCAFGMMVMFTTYIILISQFSEYVPCSCGGVIEHLTWSQHLVFNLVFVILGIVAILLYPRSAMITRNEITETSVNGGLTH